jgi:N-acetylglucosamine-6-phosphate deacetylase
MAVTVVSGRDPVTGEMLNVECSAGVVSSIHRSPGTGDVNVPWLAAGLVDLQVNGYHGFDINDENLSTNTVRALRDELLATGVTTFVPTIITNSREWMRHALQVIAQARRIDDELARAIPYVHLEGPYISDETGPRGAHEVGWVRPPDVDEFEEWQRESGGLVGMITMSPHWDGAVPFIAAVASRGVRVSIGHTHADVEQIVAAVDAGAAYSTHLGNGAHAEIARHPNYIWTQLAENRLRAGFIADGHHLSRHVFSAMLRAKGLGRSFLVSDVTALGGQPPGRYQTAIGGAVDVTDDGRLVLAGTSYLAGATASLSEGVARAVSMADISLGEAVLLATESPGRVVDPNGSRGRLVVGGPAELVTFDWRPGDASLRNLAARVSADR